MKHIIMATSKLWEIAQILWGSVVVLIVCGVWLVLTRGQDPDDHD